MHVQLLLVTQQQQLRNGETTLTASGADSWGPDKRAVVRDLWPQDAVKGPGGALADERAARTSERAPSARENITLRTKIVARVLGEKGMPARSACVRFCVEKHLCEQRRQQRKILLNVAFGLCTFPGNPRPPHLITTAGLEPA